MKKKYLYSLIALALSIGALVMAYNIAVRIDPPEISDRDMEALEWKREQLGEDFYVMGNNWLKKNEAGYWEMYVEGAPFERGVVNGKLCKELEAKQEKAFVEEIQKMIPSPFYLRFLKYFIAWFNRNIDQHIPLEYQQEIYGASFSADPTYNFIGPAYHRKLNYHGAHDIGHALQNMNLVACTSLASWGSKSADGQLIIGRNFDFYVGDKFAEQKLLCFVNPDDGYKLMMVSWPGMIGVVSGMNEMGLSLTLNAAKSDIPTAAATPVAIVARKILQYAKNIQEAYEIAQAHQTFVAESFLIGSKEDGQAAIIEKSPNRIALYYAEDEQVVCTNHFQTAAFSKDPLNVQHIKESPSRYRQKRVLELLERNEDMDPTKVAAILRDKAGLHDKDIGLGNEKAINQLIAHHAIIFKPEDKIVWVSTDPHQLGKFIAYDLDEVFAQAPGLREKRSLLLDSLSIPADTFLTPKGFQRYERFKTLRDRIKVYVADQHSPLNEDELKELERINPHYYYTYWLLGDYAQASGAFEKAISFYRQALTKEIANEFERRSIQASLLSCEKK